MLFVWLNVGLSTLSLSTAMLLIAALSSTTTESEFNVSRFNVNTELYGCTTTSEVSDVNIGNTEYVCNSIFGYRSLSASSKYEPVQEPVPPACTEKIIITKVTLYRYRLRGTNGTAAVCVLLYDA
eukprot:Lankesteria_metandrocarpae@DN5348_c1_g1_i3.p1